MTNEKSINSQKSQDPPIENGDGLDTMEASERGASERATSDGGSEPHVENETTDDLAPEERNSAASVASTADEPQDLLVLMSAEREEVQDNRVRAVADPENRGRRREGEGAEERT